MSESCERCRSGRRDLTKYPVPAAASSRKRSRAVDPRSSMLAAYRGARFQAIASARAIVTGRNRARGRPEVAMLPEAVSFGERASGRSASALAAIHAHQPFVVDLIFHIDYLVGVI